MKLKVLQEDFVKATSVVSRFVSNRATLPVLTYILFKAENQKLFLQATNLESSISYPVGASVDEVGEIALPTRVIGDLLVNFPKGQIEIEGAREKLNLISSGFRGSISGMVASDFPIIPSSIDEGGVEIETEKLIEILNTVLYAVSKDESRPILTGVFFNFQKEKLIIAGSDGFRISINSLQLNNSKFDDLKLVIPYQFMNELIKILSISPTVKLYPKKEENQVLFEIAGITLLSRVIAGDFPDFSRIIPKTYNTTVSVDRNSLTQALKLSSVFARDSANITSFEIKENEIVISSESATNGNQVTNIDAKVVGPALKVLFNYRFVEEFVHICRSEDVVIEFNESTSAVLFKDQKNSELIHIIMPVKL